MKIILPIIFIVLLIGYSFVFTTDAQSPIATPEGIYGVLLDQNALIYCQIVRQPIPDVFQTATAAARITLTVTKTPVAATWTPAVPSQELTPVPTIATTPRPLTMTALTALNVRRCSAGQNPSTACAFVRIASAGTTVQATGITFDAGSILWRKLSDGNWIAEIINGNRVLTP